MIKNLFGKPLKPQPVVTDDTIDVQTWNNRAKGGITTRRIPNKLLPDDVITWDIAGIKLPFVGEDKGHFFAILQPDIDQPPDKLARMSGCLPRQRLNAANKDFWQKIAVWAPVVVILVGFLVLFLVVQPAPT